VSFGLIHPGSPAEAATPERYSPGKKADHRGVGERDA
jgi:hypothetical protein